MNSCNIEFICEEGKERYINNCKIEFICEEGIADLAMANMPPLCPYYEPESPHPFCRHMSINGYECTNKNARMEAINMTLESERKAELEQVSGNTKISKKARNVEMIRLFMPEDVADDIKDALYNGNNLAVTKTYTTDDNKEIPKNELHLLCYDDCWFRVIIEEMEKQP